MEWAEWEDAVAINLFGVVHCCRAALPFMRKQRYGRIIVLSGGGATAPLPRISAYAASKAAVVRFVETLALEVHDDGIVVNSIAPGALNTRLLDQVLEAGPDVVGEEFHRRMEQEKERGGTPLEVGAALVRFLASPQSADVSGKLISAVWDPWQDLPAMQDRLMSSDVYTLRRIVPEDRAVRSVALRNHRLRTHWTKTGPLARAAHARRLCRSGTCPAPSPWQGNSPAARHLMTPRESSSGRTCKW